MFVAFSKIRQIWRAWWRCIVAVLIPVMLLPLLFTVDNKEAKCGYVVLWMAFYFMLEPIPLSVTALIPVVFFPLLGVLTTSEACTPFMKDTIMMYIGGLTLAAAVEHCSLHKRIALKVLLTIGTGARWLMLGFMITTMFLSMWISNTATTAMMVPIVDAVMKELEKEDARRESLKIQDAPISVIPVPTSERTQEIWKTDFKKQQYEITMPPSRGENCQSLKAKLSSGRCKKLREALLLSIAYSANCGGTGTIIGSGPNLVLKGIMEETFPESTELTFASWLLYNTPGMVICVAVSWVGLQFFFLPCCTRDESSTEAAAKKAILKSYQELGNITFHEGGVAILFLLLVALWFLRDPQFIDGWASYITYGKNIRDATPAIGVCLLLFLIPSRPSLTEHSPPLLDWKTAQRKISWGVLLLLGSGFAVSEAAKKSGLSIWLGRQLSYLNFLSPDVIVVILTFLTSALTEVISNMSMATIMLPVISQMAVAIRVHPLFLMLPVTISCSFAMMLPVGNPSNAIVFDASTMTTFDMIKPGFILKILCCSVQLLMIETLGVALFNLKTYPSWANETLMSYVTNPTWIPEEEFNVTETFLLNS